MSAEAPHSPPPPDPWRSTRKRRKSRAAMEAEEDAAAAAELGDPPRKRRRGAEGKGGATRRTRAATVEAPEARQPVGVAAGAEAPEEVKQPVGVVAMEVNDALEANGTTTDDMCAEEPDLEMMRMEEAAALLEAEEQAMGGERAGSAGAGNWVGRPRPERYRAEDPASSRTTRSDGGMTTETRAKCHYGAASFDLGNDVYMKALIPAAAPPELWRSARKRKKSRTAKEAAEAEMERVKRRRGAAGNAGTARRRTAKVEVPELKQPVGVAEMEVGDDDVCAAEPDREVMRMDEEEEEAAALEAEEEQAMEGAGSVGVRKRVGRPSTQRRAVKGAASEDYFVGEPVPDDEARRRWPERYKAKDSASTHARRRNVQEELRAKCHYRAACVDGATIDLGDDVYIKAAPGEENYIGRITEFFQGMDQGSYFTCRWFYRVADTVISRELLLKVRDHKHDHKRVFLSDHKDDNLLNSIISKVNVMHVDPNNTPQAKAHIISKSDFYYDMSYSVAYSTFANVPSENGDATSSEPASDISCDDVDSSKGNPIADLAPPPIAQTETATLLDLYSGCGAMSTGLCLGAALSGIKLNTKWAVDVNTDACNSLKYNHPDTQVRNEKAENFLSLLQQWDALCKKYGIQNSNSVDSNFAQTSKDENKPLPEGTFEIERLVDICYGDLNNNGKGCLWFKVRWKTYDPSQDTWEPLDGLSNSLECIKEFVESGYRESILPLPGCVDVICGGPPCQGISGLNRFRNPEDPLEDERNQQLVVFMDIVNYLRPKYVLMENVVDILKFADGFLGRYALSRLVSMSYQARLGMMVAGCYGLPQFRMRAFLWGALPSVVLPKFPLPTHGVVNRGLVPKAFSHCVVAYREDENKLLKKALVIRDAISDLPKVENYQPKDVMKYQVIPTTEFQRYIRLNRKDMMDYSFGVDSTPEQIQLFDHQPLQLNPDDYERVQKIPIKKGANFRDLEGVQVGENNTVEFVPDKPRVLLSSRKPLVPSYAMTYCKGKSRKPFGRLWWDETVPTVITRAEPHTQIILHPSQHRVLTVRENARLQGFPDYYRLSGPVIEKYIQVGNAVAVPVARALGYSFGQAYQGEFSGDQPLFELPGHFIPVDQATTSRSAIGSLIWNFGRGGSVGRILF